MQYVEKTGDMIARYLRPGQIVSLESTTYPGTTDEVLLPKFADGSLKPAGIFFLFFHRSGKIRGIKIFLPRRYPKWWGG